MAFPIVKVFKESENIGTNDLSFDFRLFFRYTFLKIALPLMDF